jgi:hypothetical protein
VFSTPIGFTEEALLLKAFVEDTIALDPPDRNYRMVTAPVPFSLPSTGHAGIDKAIVDYLKVVSLDLAKLHALERYEAASLAGDTSWIATQRSAYQIYAIQADAARTVLPQDDIVLAKSLASAKVNSYPGGTAVIAAACNAQADKPLPTDLNLIFLSLGLTQAQIDKGIAEVALAVRPTDIDTNLSERLLDSIP